LFFVNDFAFADQHAHRAMIFPQVSLQELCRYSTIDHHDKLAKITTAVSKISDGFAVKLPGTDSRTKCAVVQSQLGIPMRVWDYP